MSAAVGDRVGRYVLLRALDGGGDRWLAFDPALQRRVRLELENADAGGVERMAAARRLARIHAATVVAVHDVGELDGRPFVAREYVDGTELEVAAAEARTVAELRDWCVALAAGLAALHAAGLAHRGLGEHGALVVDGARARMGAFAAARVVEPDDPARPADVRELCARLQAAVAAAAPRLGTRALAGLAVCIRETGRAADASVLAERVRVAAARRRRRVGALGIVTVASAVAWVGVGRGLVTAAVPGCGDASAELPGIWDAQIAGRIEAIFAATDSPLAAEASAATTRTLAAYVARWTATRAEVCATTELTTPVRDAAMVCLDRRRGELEALLAVLLAADAELVPRASQAALTLGAVEDCRDPDPEIDAALPTDPHARARVTAVDGAIAQVHALGSAGRYARAVEVGLAVPRGDLEGIDGRRRGRLALEIGVARGKAGDAEASLDDLAAALGVAWREGSASLATEAWVELAFTQAEYLKRPQDALSSIELAEATATRGPDRPRALARLLQVRGVVLLRLTRSDEAREALAQALALREELTGDELGTASTLNSLANAHIQLRRFDDAEPLYRRSLAIYASVLGHDHPEIASVSNNLAVLYYRTDRGDEALGLVREAHRIRTATLGDDHPETVAALDNIGVMLAALGRLDDALPVLEHSLRTRDRILPPGHPSIADSLVNYGDVLVQLGRGAEARAAFERALEIDLAVNGEHHFATSVTLQNLGRALEAEGRPAEALAVYERALHVRDALPDRVDEDLVATLHHVVESAQDAGAMPRAREALARARAMVGDPPAVGDVAMHRYLEARDRWYRGERTAALAELGALQREVTWPPFRAQIAAWLATHPAE